MFDIGWTELLVIAIVLIVVVGPKDLPPMLRAFGKMTSNLRKMATDFRTQFDQALREADMDDVRQTISDAQRFHPANAIREAINPLRQMGDEIRSDLQKATAVPEPVQPAVPLTEAVPAALPLSSPPVAAPPAPAVSAPATSAPAAGPVDEVKAKKPRAPRKVAAKIEALPAPEEPPLALPKPKRSRTSKAVTVAPIETAVVAVPGKKAPAARRKRTETPKDEA
jgi:sec-independent protein translocase protein TatB